MNKPNNPGRPIISNNYTLIEHLSHFVDTQLKPYAQTTNSFTKNTTNFLNKLKKIKTESVKNVNNQNAQENYLIQYRTVTQRLETIC